MVARSLHGDSGLVLDPGCGWRDNVASSSPPIEAVPAITLTPQGKPDEPEQQENGCYEPQEMQSESDTPDEQHQ